MSGIATVGLTKVYAGRRVVDTLDLCIPPGTVYGLLGRNGSGKSTVIRMLLGMTTPDRGRAELLGEDAARLRPETRARVAYVAEGHPLYGGLTVGEMIAFARSFHRAPERRWNDERLRQMLEYFHLRTGARIRRLSHGQRAQLSLALALAPDPEVLILDDPTLGLDAAVRRDFLESLLRLIERPGRTILFTSHILSDVERIADHIGILIDGVLRADCPTESFGRSVSRVELQFVGEAPLFPACRGLISSQRDGGRLEAVIVGLGDEHRRLIESLEPRSWDAAGMNLEDAFIAYTRRA